MKNTIRQFVPPILWQFLSQTKRKTQTKVIQRLGHKPSEQDLNLYWDKEFAKVLDTWGEGTAWHEIVLLLATSQGKVLDIACGTGKTIRLFDEFPQLEVHGCDISDYLIQKAVALGVPQNRLTVCDATKTPYQDNEFAFSYSIGSLEHFIEEGIEAFVHECHRITQYRTFHMMPFSRSETDEGWITPLQSYYNNSTDWWINKFKLAYSRVWVVESLWNDDISNGKWIIAEK